MKKVIAAFLMLAFLSCSKEETLDLYGSYNGNIDVFINNARQTVLPGYEMKVNPSIDKHSITISHNVLMTATASLQGTQLSIPKTTVGTGPNMFLIEYGTGQFVNNVLTIEFTQEYEINGNITTRTRWVGSLARKK